MSSSPHNNSPDNATPDNSTPDDADNSSSPPLPSPPPRSPPPSSPPPSSPPPSSPPPSSPPPSSSSSSNSPPTPASPNNQRPPSPNGSSQSPPPPASTRSPPSFESPPHKSLQPPPHKSEGGNKNGGGSGGNSGSGGGGGNGDNSKVVVGAVVGVGSLLLILVIVCIVCSRRKKKKRLYYYGPGDQSLEKGNNYYNSGQHVPGYYGNPHGDHVVRVQNGIGPSGPGGWGAPPPPPPMMNSADMSSNYSTGPVLPPPSPSLALGLKGTFSYEELATATSGFADANLIGQGGFGYVHKGVLPNGKEVAVKSLKTGSGQGEREFQAEIDIISRVHHRHLVSLVGYCISGGQRMLVYEFIPNNTLEYHLHGKGRPTMDWPTRMRIAIGSAKGLAYLHEDCHPRIIHRDIKAANVLIDDSFEAKVADFGLAKLTTDNNTHVSTRVMGTFGYLAPEYASSGKLTEKSDVFSFGVMLLELVTGKRPVDHSNVMEDSLVDWARPLLTRGLEEDGNFGELVDPFLEGNYNPQELSRMAACAAASIRHSSKKRPKMSQIVRILEGDVSLDDLRDGIRPGPNALNNSDQYDTMQYNADLQKFRKAVFSNSDEFGTSSGSSEEVKHRQPSGALIFIKEELEISDTQQEVLAGILNICALVGSLIAGRTADYIGRRWTIILASILFMVGSILMGYGPNFTLLMAGRCVAGIGVGFALLIAPVYSAEISPAKSRGFLSSLPELCIGIGILLGYIINYFLGKLSLKLGWRLMLGIAAVPSLVLIFGILAMPESPRWLVVQGRLEQAKKVLSQISNSEEEAEMRFQDIKMAAGIDDNKPKEIDKHTEKKNGGGVWKELFIRPTYAVRWMLIVAVGIHFFEHATGIEAVMLYSPRIFKKAGVTSKDKLLLTTIGVGITKVCSLIIATFFLDRVGRRRLLLISCGGMICSLTVLGFSLTMVDTSHKELLWALALSIIATYFYVGFFNMGLAPVTWVYSSEIFPLKLRAQGASIGVAVNRLTNAAISMSFISIYKAITIGGAFFLFAGMSILAWLFFYFFLPETKGRALEEMEMIFSKYNRRNVTTGTDPTNNV
ncbi:hypothetical protein Fmac_002504 [Flemingia macrophylla]|uniref:non-specific serine/threonine protein kinase n=1 Tax=Flemingia macrophylla TaxID=520843 RepID=A0ABD1NK51_9FABA